MENRQLLLFERNRYYVGKLLTSTDFQAEQTYFNNKRRFMNNMMFGSGIVCGLGVYSLDDLSIMLESGVAIDGLGREIVVENSVVRKLSAIEGFESLSSENAMLCLRYREEEVHPVYTVNKAEQEEEYEFNRIHEGWELFLTDAELMEEIIPEESEFLAQGVLYEDSDFRVSVLLPSTVSCGEYTKAVVQISKISGEEKKFSLEGKLQTPGFSGKNGEHELNIYVKDLFLQEGESFDCVYWIAAQQQEAEETVIIARPESIKIVIDGKEEKQIEESLIIKLSISAEPVEKIISREIGKISLESRSFPPALDYIKLAEISLQLTKNAYIIDRIDEKNVKKYVYATADNDTRLEYESWFRNKEALPVSTSTERSDGVKEPGRVSFQEPLYATGTCEIPLGEKARRGGVFYSDEIMHGLGPGNVYVKVGFEYLTEDPRLSATAKNTIYGDPSLFEEENLPLYYAQTAVKVMNDRGSFVVAARLDQETSYVVMQLRWIAIKAPSEDDRTALQKISGKSISAVQPTTLLATRESCYFNVNFHNMEPCGLTYELMDNDSGTITADGVYTAPAREGVYEIRISCADMPLISTFAYAIVKKRDKEDEDAVTS